MSTLYSVGYVTLFLTSLATQQAKYDNRFLDTPANHWAYQAQADLKSVGLSFESMDSFGFRVRARTRYVFAVSTNGACSNLKDKVRDLQGINEAIAHYSGAQASAFKSISDRTQSLNRDIKRLRKILPTIQADILNLTKEFSYELKSLGVDLAEREGQIRRDCQVLAAFRIAKLGEANNQFADVPETHWAASSIRSLRTAGILHGYDGALFKG